MADHFKHLLYLLSSAPIMLSTIFSFLTPVGVVLLLLQSIGVAANDVTEECSDQTQLHSDCVIFNRCQSDPVGEIFDGKSTCSDLFTVFDAFEAECPMCTGTGMDRYQCVIEFSNGLDCDMDTEYPYQVCSSSLQDFYQCLEMQPDCPQSGDVPLCWQEVLDSAPTANENCEAAGTQAWECSKSNCPACQGDVLTYYECLTGCDARSSSVQHDVTILLSPSFAIALLAVQLIL